MQLHCALQKEAGIHAELTFHQLQTMGLAHLAQMHAVHTMAYANGSTCPANLVVFCHRTYLCSSQNVEM